MAKTIELEMRKPVGKVTPKERDEIQNLFERKNGLIELFKSIVNVQHEELEDSNFYYEKIVKDLGSVTVKFQKWWDEMSYKYKWESKKGYKWEIDFNTCEIFLVKE